MNEKTALSSEHEDFLRELMNIAAGNAGTALSQLFNREVEVRIPDVRIGPIKTVLGFLKKHTSKVACAKMELVGDVRGVIFFFVPDRDKEEVIHLAERLHLGRAREGGAPDYSVLEEVANIVCGAALTAIHDFCKMEIRHSVPMLAFDMVQAILDESIIERHRGGGDMLFVEMEYEFGGGNGSIYAFIIMVPDRQFIHDLAGALAEGRRQYGLKYNHG